MKKIITTVIIIAVIYVGANAQQGIRNIYPGHDLVFQAKTPMKHYHFLYFFR